MPNCKPTSYVAEFSRISCWDIEDDSWLSVTLNKLSALSSDSIKDSNGRVLVHCQAGISRSATICLAYLMKKKRVRLEEAFEFVKQRRSIISPNFSFMGQLLQFESQVLATSCSVEAASPSATLGPKSSSTPSSPFIFSFPVSVVTHSQPSSLTYLQSPITTSPSCWCLAPPLPEKVPPKTALAQHEGFVETSSTRRQFEGIFLGAQSDFFDKRNPGPFVPSVTPSNIKQTHEWTHNILWGQFISFISCGLLPKVCSVIGQQVSLDLYHFLPTLLSLLWPWEEWLKFFNRELL